MCSSQVDGLIQLAWCITMTNCWGICIYAWSQSKYISVFSFILFMYYFSFTVCTSFLFFLKFPLVLLQLYSPQKPVTLTRHSYFCFRLGDHSSCEIKLYYTLHSCPFRCQLSHMLCGIKTEGQSWAGYMLGQTCTHTSLPSDLTITEEVRAHINPSFSFLLIIY